MNYKIFASHCMATTVAILSSDADADQETDLMLINSCNNCHPFNITIGHTPNISGLPREYFLSALKEFKDNTRTGTIMNRIMSTYKADDMEKLADYYSSSSPIPPRH